MARSLGLAAVALAAVAYPVIRAERGVSERYAFETYREQAGGVTVLVDSYAASLRAGEAYLPLSVAVGLEEDAHGVTVTRETFTLVDSSGNRHPAAGPMEIRERYALVSLDRSLLRIRPLVVGQQFDGRVRLPSNFYADGRGVGVVQDTVNLSPSTWFHDVLYFPHPEGGLDGTLTLRLDGGGLPAPVEVRFRVLPDNVRKGF